MALTSKLTAIADAIRAKTGGTGKLSLDDMPTAIAGIETGGTVGFDVTFNISSADFSRPSTTYIISSENYQPMSISQLAISAGDTLHGVLAILLPKGQTLTFDNYYLQWHADISSTSSAPSFGRRSYMNRGGSTSYAHIVMPVENMTIASAS